MSKKEERETEFETWLSTRINDEKLRGEILEKVGERISPMENTIKALRDERDNSTRELKDLAKKITEDSEAGKQLGELRAKLEASERKSNFIEQAVKNGVIRPTAAYAIANTENLYTEDGNPDWKKIKESVPELFKTANTNTNAGSGTTKNALPGRNVNDAIRDAVNKHK